MHLNAKRPIFVPPVYWAEFDKLSKAALMDMVWDYANQTTGLAGPDFVMDEFRKRREIILIHRKQAD